MRIEALAAAAGVAVAWKPFLLGPIFKAQGWDTSPFNLYPAKGRYMVRDLERLAAERGLRFALPAVFPQNSLRAARLALVGGDEGWIAPFTRAVYRGRVRRRRRHRRPRRPRRRSCDGLHLDSERLLSRIEQADIKARLKQQTAEAQARGIFGAPSFSVGGELFWGDDRLEQALAVGRAAPEQAFMTHSSDIRQDRARDQPWRRLPCTRHWSRLWEFRLPPQRLRCSATRRSPGAEEEGRPKAAAKKPSSRPGLQDDEGAGSLRGPHADCTWVAESKDDKGKVKAKAYCRAKPKAPAKKAEPKK